MVLGLFHLDWNISSVYPAVKDIRKYLILVIFIETSSRMHSFLKSFSHQQKENRDDLENVKMFNQSLAEEISASDCCQKDSLQCARLVFPHSGLLSVVFLDLIQS